MSDQSPTPAPDPTTPDPTTQEGQRMLADLLDATVASVSHLTRWRAAKAIRVLQQTADHLQYELEVVRLALSIATGEWTGGEDFDLDYQRSSGSEGAMELAIDELRHGRGGAR